MSTCKRCGAPMVWVKTAAGKAMPCDPDAILYREQPGGKLKIVTDDGRVVSGVQDDTSETWGRVSHFATCPYANEFRRRA